MKSNADRGSKSNLEVTLIAIVATVALLLLVTSVSKFARELNRDLFVIEVSNEWSHDLKDVRISGLGKIGNLGLIRPQEVRRVVVEQGVLSDRLDFYWVGLSGKVANFGRPEEWEAGTHVDGHIFKVTLRDDRSISFADEKLKLLYRLKYCR
jgi:hypothetical protein